MENPQVITSKPPGKFSALAYMTLASGIINVLYGLILTGSVILGTFFFGIICAPLTILPTVLGVFEILYAIKLLSNPPQPVKPSQTLAIFEISSILLLGVIPAVVGILALVFYNDPEVQAYFNQINTPVYSI